MSSAQATCPALASSCNAIVYRDTLAKQWKSTANGDDVPEVDYALGEYLTGGTLAEMTGNGWPLVHMAGVSSSAWGLKFDYDKYDQNPVCTKDSPCCLVNWGLASAYQQGTWSLNQTNDTCRQHGMRPQKSCTPSNGLTNNLPCPHVGLVNRAQEVALGSPARIIAAAGTMWQGAKGVVHVAGKVAEAVDD